ncbi:MAG: hypothetical protein SGCHY_002895, partial [Lobulomycetales sp.]
YGFSKISARSYNRRNSTTRTNVPSVYSHPLFLKHDRSLACKISRNSKEFSAKKRHAQSVSPGNDNIPASARHPPLAASVDSSSPNYSDSPNDSGYPGSSGNSTAAESSRSASFPRKEFQYPRDLQRRHSNEDSLFLSSSSISSGHSHHHRHYQPHHRHQHQQRRSADDYSRLYDPQHQQKLLLQSRHLRRSNPTPSPNSHHHHHQHKQQQQQQQQQQHQISEHPDAMQIDTQEYVECDARHADGSSEHMRYQRTSYRLPEPAWPGPSVTWPTGKTETDDLSRYVTSNRRADDTALPPHPDAARAPAAPGSEMSEDSSLGRTDGEEKRGAMSISQMLTAFRADPARYTIPVIRNQGSSKKAASSDANVPVRMPDPSGRKRRGLETRPLGARRDSKTFDLGNTTATTTSTAAAMVRTTACTCMRRCSKSMIPRSGSSESRIVNSYNYCMCLRSARCNGNVNQDF